MFVWGRMSECVKYARKRLRTVFAHAQVLFFVILSVAEWASPFGIGNGIAVVWFALEILLTAVCMFTLKTKVLEADWAGTKLLDNPLGNGARFISSKIGDITKVLIGAIAAIVVGLVIKNGGEAPDPEVMTWLAFPGKLWLNGLKVQLLCMCVCVPFCVCL
jgi:hypothetical protein